MGAVTGKTWTDYSEPRIMAADLEAIEAAIAASGEGLMKLVALTSGTVVDDLPFGRFYAISASIAASLVGGPTEGVSRQACIIDVTPANVSGTVKSIKWTIIPNINDPMLTWRKHLDGAGTWSPWNQDGAFRRARAASDCFTWAVGQWNVVNATTAQTIVNRPPAPAAGQAANVWVDGVGDGATRTIRWKIIPNHAELAREWEAHRDTAGTWSQWREVLTSTPPAPTGEAALPTLAPLAAANHDALRGAARLAMTGEPDTHPARWTADAGVKVTTPTSDGTGQTVHPKVVDTGETGWNGWRYWMAHTPYPFADDSKENPEIIVSNDGTTWQVPSGLVNPLDDQPGTPDYYNSDTHLVLAGGTMYLIWRTSRTSPSASDQIHWRTSADGVTWTAKHTIYTSDSPGTVYGQMVSPALVKMPTGWRMYIVAVNAHPNRMVYLDTAMEIPSPADWGTPVRCQFDGQDEFILGRDVWHIDVIQDGSAWWALLNDCEPRTGGVNGDLYLARSEDGASWQASMVPLLPKYSTGHDALYRGCLVQSGTGPSSTFDVFYSARVTQNQRFHVYRTAAARDC